MLSFNDFSNFHMLKIFSYIDSQNLLQMELVSKRWHEVIKESILYLQNCLANLETSNREFFFDFQPIEEKSKIAKRLELKKAWLMKVPVNVFLNPKIMNKAYADSELCFLLDAPLRQQFESLESRYPQLTNFNENIFALAGINEVAKKLLKTQGKNDAELLKVLNLVKEVILVQNLSKETQKAIVFFFMQQLTFVIDDEIKNSPLLKHYLNFECDQNDPGWLANFAFERFKLELTRGLISYLYLATKSNPAVLSNNIGYWLEVIDAVSSKVNTLQFLTAPVPAWSCHKEPDILRALKRDLMVTSKLSLESIVAFMNIAIRIGFALSALFLFFFTTEHLIEYYRKNDPHGNDKLLNTVLLTIPVGLIIAGYILSIALLSRTTITPPTTLACPSNSDLLTQIDSQKGQLKEISCFFKNLEKEAVSQRNKFIDFSDESKKER